MLTQNEVIDLIRKHSLSKPLDLSNKVLTHLNLSHMDLRHVDFSGADLTGTDFTGSNLILVKLTGAKLSDVDFSNARLRSADLSGATLSNVDFSYADCRFAKFLHVDFTDKVIFNSTNLRCCYLEGARFNYEMMNECDIRYHTGECKCLDY